MPAFAASAGYVINVLAGDQIELAQRFSGPGAGRFEALPFKLSEGGLPLLSGTVAWFECRHRSRYPEGEHVIFVGEVERCHSHPQRTLGFHRGRFIAL
jgi:flavin reductase (DIM6/NTAB) family NADH-FMN oxidoreductase RutF